MSVSTTIDTTWAGAQAVHTPAFAGCSPQALLQLCLPQHGAASAPCCAASAAHAAAVQPGGELSLTGDRTGGFPDAGVRMGVVGECGKGSVCEGSFRP